MARSARPCSASIGAGPAVVGPTSRPRLHLRSRRRLTRTRPAQRTTRPALGAVNSQFIVKLGACERPEHRYIVVSGRRWSPADGKTAKFGLIGGVRCHRRSLARNVCSRSYKNGPEIAPRSPNPSPPGRSDARPGNQFSYQSDTALRATRQQ